jgi:orotate phosphoribosyltransferase
LQNTQGNDQAYFWNKIDNEAAKQISDFLLHEQNTQVIDEVTDLPHPVEHVKEIIGRTDVIIVPEAKVFYENSLISDRLYTIVKEKKLFHSGHFHWSETSRAHNWIDVSKLLEEHETLYFVQNAIIDIIEKFNLAENCSLVVGLGYEGNIIASKAAIRYNISYSSLPYSYRYEDHHDYENKLNYDNSAGSYKHIIIITDVVNDGRTIRKLVYEREKDFFKNVEKIIVLSLFYTGHQEIDKNILNFDKLPAGYDLQNDYKVNNIEYYTVKSLRVEKCPYGDNYREECFIYKDGLSCVHMFYAE